MSETGGWIVEEGVKGRSNSYQGLRGMPINVYRKSPYLGNGDSQKWQPPPSLARLSSKEEWQHGEILRLLEPEGPVDRYYGSGAPSCLEGKAETRSD